MKFDEVTKYKTWTLLSYCKMQKAGWGQGLKFGLVITNKQTNKPKTSKGTKYKISTLSIHK